MVLRRLQRTPPIGRQKGEYPVGDGYGLNGVLGDDLLRMLKLCIFEQLSMNYGVWDECELHGRLFIGLIYCDGFLPSIALCLNTTVYLNILQVAVVGVRVHTAQRTVVI